MIKVANFIEDGRIAGPQKRIALIANELKQYGFETTVIIPDRESRELSRHYEYMGVMFFPLRINRPAREFKSLMKYLYYFPGEILSIIRHLKSSQYSLIHVSGGAWQIKGVLAGWIAGIPVIWHLNDTSVPKLVFFIFRVLSNLASAFFVSAERVREYYFSDEFQIKKPIFIIRPPVDTEKYKRTSRELVDFCISGITKPIVMSVANVNPNKGIEVLISAAILLREKGVRYSTVIVGPIYDSQQDYFVSLKKKLQENCLDGYFHFIGAVSSMPSMLMSADVLVCSSYNESGPMAIFEGMSMECPIVCTDVGDMSQLIINGFSGYIVRPGDYEAMANRIQTLLSSNSLRLNMGGLARQSAVKNFDVRDIGKKTAQAYATLIR